MPHHLTGPDPDDLLPGLDDVPWQDLGHAYGVAADVPGQLLALASADALVRKEACYALFGNVWHQGTVYEASAPAARFLLMLAEREEVPERHLILCLLHALATGSSYAAVHEHTHNEPGYKERLRRELGWVRAARKAVKEGVPVLVGLLCDQDGMVRTGASHVLGAFSEMCVMLAPELRKVIEAEPPGVLRAGMILCLGDLEDASEATVSFLVQQMEGALSEAERIAAAVALAKIARERAPGEVVVILHRATRESDDACEWFGGLPWDVDSECVNSALRLVQGSG